MKILLADDHTLFRDALVAYLERAEPDAQVIVAEDLMQARERLVSDGIFELALLDWQMPGVQGVQSIRDLISLFPKTRFALMSGVVEDEDVKKSLDAGMWGFFPKTLSGRSLVSGIQKILRGEKFVPTVAGTENIQPSYYADDYFYKPPGKTGARDSAQSGVNDTILTDRELQVLNELGQGRTNAEISVNLKIQQVTVKLHVRNICRKLGVRNRTEAALKARTMKLVSGV